VSVAWVSGLGRWASVVAAAALTVTASALVVALMAEAGAHAASQELSGRLVPADAAAALLLDEYVEGQSSLRNYVTTGQPVQLLPYTAVTSQIPAQEAMLAVLLRGYPGMEGRLAAAVAARLRWRARVAGPQLAAAARGNFARARALQADVPFTQPYVIAVSVPITSLGAQIASEQTNVTDRLAGAQGRLLAALAAVCAVMAVIAVGGAAGVRRWLLRPLVDLRGAAESVAAGRYDTRVPAAGPAELADLGRSTELMRTRLVTALAGAGQAERRFRGLFESSPDATLTVAADGSILMVNEQAEDMFGYSPGELVGQPVEMLVPAAARGTHPHERAGYLADPGARLMGRGRELHAVRKDGQEFPVEIRLNSLPGDPGTAALATVRDISGRLAAAAERERVGQRLQQSERLDSLGQLVGGVAHDFNNLLSVITGYVGFVTEEVTSLAGEDERMVAVLADIEQVRGAAQRAISLTRQLLIFARSDVVHPEVLSINGIVSGVEELLRRTLGEHIDLTIDLDEEVWPVKSDPGQLEQVLVNLAVNARDAMPGGGKLTIDTGNVDADEAYTASRPELKPGRYARLRVSDTGTGMDSAVLARVFEPFYSTKPKGRGTGLGLATVYGIVTHAGGHVQIYSEPGHGTSVSALLPLTDEAVPAARPPAAAPAPGRGETILLVEDEASLWELSRRILVRNGYQVCPAATAVDAVRHASDLAQPIDLLLTDLVMPDMLGNEVAARVRAVRPGLPVLYMSGYAQPILDSQGALDPHVDLLEKPFSEVIMLARVREVIDDGSEA
jgi:PAS domain S-box-containing protein